MKQILKNYFKIIGVTILLLSIGGLFIFGKTKRAEAFGVKVPITYPVCGIDVSRYQQNINWTKVAKARGGKEQYAVQFAFMKATEGKTLIDPHFKDNWKNSKKNNIIRGAYHYYKPNVTSTLQAKNFIATVKLEKGDLPPVLDIEETGRYGNDNMLRGLKNWLKIVEKHYGVKPIIYCFANYYDRYFKDNKDFKDYPFWIAHHHKPSLKVSSSQWHFWQHSDKAEVEGIKGKVCFNAFNGTLNKLKELCK